MSDPCGNEKRNRELAQHGLDEERKNLANHVADPLNWKDSSPEKYQQESQRLKENLNEKENDLKERIKELEDCQNKNRTM